MTGVRAKYFSPARFSDGGLKRGGNRNELLSCLINYRPVEKIHSALENTCPASPLKHNDHINNTRTTGS